MQKNMTLFHLLGSVLCKKTAGLTRRHKTKQKKPKPAFAVLHSAHTFCPHHSSDACSNLPWEGRLSRKKNLVLINPSILWFRLSTDLVCNLIWFVFFMCSYLKLCLKYFLATPFIVKYLSFERIYNHKQTSFLQRSVNKILIHWEVYTF